MLRSEILLLPFGSFISWNIVFFSKPYIIGEGRSVMKKQDIPNLPPKTSCFYVFFSGDYGEERSLCYNLRSFCLVGLANSVYLCGFRGWI